MNILVDADYLYSLNKVDSINYLVELLDDLSLVVGESMIKSLCKFYVNSRESSYICKK